GHCARFMNDGGVRFWEMAPHGELAGTGVCLARPGEEYVVYSPTAGAFTVDLSATGEGPLDARWYNPETGELAPAAEVLGGRVAEFAPPFAADAVLHLKRKER
ncbi:MAG: hypothetical protein FJX74_18995, partial [Armatimonadetes bacterium]|nr:hypothetical protein [Armatimonadota bacterium]